MFACKSINMRAFHVKNIVHFVKKMFHATFLQRNERKITIFQSSTFLTSPGTIPNSSLKHLVKYDGAEKPTA